MQAPPDVRRMVSSGRRRHNPERRNARATDRRAGALPSAVSEPAFTAPRQGDYPECPDACSDVAHTRGNPGRIPHERRGARNSELPRWGPLSVIARSPQGDVAIQGSVERPTAPGSRRALLRPSTSSGRGPSVRGLSPASRDRPSAKATTATANSAIGQSSGRDLGQPIALQQHAAHDAHRMRGGKDLAEPIAPRPACRGTET